MIARCFLALACLSLNLSVAAPVELSKEQTDFFETKVRPILSGHCYKCHSLEQGKAKGDLTLDTREGVLKGGKDGVVLKPGDPDGSLLITAIGYQDPDLQMPPKGEKLSTEQIAVLTAWVKMGAPDPRDAPAGNAKLTGLTDKARGHWAYQPVQKPAVPTPQNQQWCRTPVDAFILQKLEEQQFAPAPDADKETLLRRATYDLIGLPPTTTEVEAFLADSSPLAFAKVVDRLLASPHYGERWGRHWLDTARYSDTAGGERNALRGQDYRYAYAWTYRDYVVRAFNEDKPYDRFIVEQLAADKLPEAQPDKTLLAALGFLTVGERFRNPNDIINDRIDVVTKGFLGMTVSCARCHDHMFDPVPTEDYYALHGVFASTIEPEIKPVVATPDANQRADFEEKLKALEEENRAIYYKVVERILGELHGKMGPYLLAAQGAPRRGAPPLTAEEIKERDRISRENKLDRYLVQLLVRTLRADDSVFGPFKAFAALKSSEFAEAAPKLAADIAARSGAHRRAHLLIAAAFQDAQLSTMSDVAAIYTRIFEGLSAQRSAYLEACAKAGTENVAVDREMIALLEVPFPILPAAKVTTSSLRDFAGRLPQQLLNRAGFIFARINELELTHPGAPPRAMLVADARRIGDSRVFIRGQAQNRGAEVPRRFLAVLSPGGKPLPFKEGSGRLELAQSIASESNPLTARVLVNRVWMHHFGEGFVRTPDDLGTQSEAPSHPELLDYLAAEFMENGWSLKKLHRLVMLSRVYQQSSRTQPEFARIDPENRLLWRANIRRLDFEATRDSLLVFGGCLDQTIGGQPINLTEEPYSHRRSVYGYIDRGNLPDLMANFDFSDPDMPNSKRTTTIVPQQALFLMNSAMSVDVARRVAARPDVRNATSDLERVRAIYRVIFQRTPHPDEIELALRFVDEETRQQAALEDAAAAKAKPRKPGRPSNREQQQARAGFRPIQNRGSLVPRNPLTPWETYAHGLLLSNEAAYVH